MTSLRWAVLAATATLLLTTGLIASSASSNPAGPAEAAIHTSATPGGIGLDLVGTGWAAYDIPVATDTALTLTLRHDTMDDLCLFSESGRGTYDQGHHTFVFFWRLGDDPIEDSELWFWTGTPYNDFWPEQTGECGVLDPLSLQAGDTARLIVATTVPGFHADITADGDVPTERQDVSLEARPDHAHAFPVPSAALSAPTALTTTHVGHEWRATFEVQGPTFLLAHRWTHSDGDGGYSEYAYAEERRIGFEGAEAYDPPANGMPAEAVWGFGQGLTTDTQGWAPALAHDAGHVEAFVQHAAAVVAHTGNYDRGVDFLSIPFGAGA